MTRELDYGELKNNVLNILKQYCGPDDCIKMAVLFYQATGENIIPARRYDQTRNVRSVICELRNEGSPIGNKSGKDGGYFMARNEKELQETVGAFHSRAMSSLRQEAALKRIPFGELLKQFELEYSH